MRTILQDVRFGARILRRHPGVTAASALTLSLAIGALTTIFGMLNGIVLRPLAYPDADRLAVLGELSPEKGQFPVSLSAFLEWRSASRSFAKLVAVEWRSMLLTGVPEAEQVVVRAASPELFSILGVTPALGRVYGEQERAVVLTDALWERRFGRDPGVEGRAVLLDGHSYTVAGVLPREFQFYKQADAFLPLPPRPDPGARTAQALGLLAPGVTLAQARDELLRLAGNRALAGPPSGRGWSVTVTGLQESLVRGPRQDLPVLLCAAAFLLLIACANIAGLVVARTAARKRELAIRASLGADRMRLLRHLLVENLVLSLMAGLAGLGLAASALPLVRGRIPAGVIPNPEAIAIDWRVAGFTFLLCLVSAVAFGLAPAWTYSGQTAQGAAARGSRTSRGMPRLRSALVVGELALSLVLLSGAGLMLRALAGVQRTTIGPSPSQVVTLRLVLPAHRYPDPARATAFVQQALEAFSGSPLVRSTAAATALPYGGGAEPVKFEMAHASAGTAATGSAIVVAVSGSYFGALGPALRAGRDFRAGDAAGASRVAIVSESFARRFAGGASLVGQSLRLEDGSVAEIVGLAADWRADTRRDAEPPLIFVPIAQRAPREVALLLLAAPGAATTLLAVAPAMVRQLDRDQPAAGLATLSELRDRQLAIPRLLASLTASLGAMAFVLALLGVYSLASHSVTERFQEFSIRSALGADPSDIFLLVGRRWMSLCAIGVTLGLAGAAGLSRLLRGLVLGVPTHDYAVGAGAAVILLAASLAANYIPARRAIKTDPAAALRPE